jgi:hypothetical protein
MILSDVPPRIRLVVGILISECVYMAFSDGVQEPGPIHVLMTQEISPWREYVLIVNIKTVLMNWICMIPFYNHGNTDLVG